MTNADKSELPIEVEEDNTGKTEQDTMISTDENDSDPEEMPTWFIWIIVAGGSVVVICGAVLLIVLSKNKVKK